MESMCACLLVYIPGVFIWRYGTAVGARATSVVSDMKFLVPGLGSCCRIHLIALLVIAIILCCWVNLNYTCALYTQQRGLFTLLCICENL